jgi:hypothetical protein
VRRRTQGSGGGVTCAAAGQALNCCWCGADVVQPPTLVVLAAVPPRVSAGQRWCRRGNTRLHPTFASHAVEAAQGLNSAEEPRSGMTIVPARRPSAALARCTPKLAREPLLVTLGALALVVGIQDQRRSPFLIGIVVLSLAPYVHLIAAITGACIVAWLWWLPSRAVPVRRAWATGIFAVLVAPIAAISANRGTAQLSWTGRGEYGGVRSLLAVIWENAGRQPDRDHRGWRRCGRLPRRACDDLAPRADGRRLDCGPRRRVGLSAPASSSWSPQRGSRCL